MPADLQSSLRALRRRVTVATWLGALSRHLLALFFLVGVGVLLLRALADWPTGRALWLAALLLVAPASAWLVARRRRLSDGAAAAWLDLRGGGGGALVTELELSDPVWQPRTRDALRRAGEFPDPRLAPPARRVGLGVLFALAAFLVPIPARAGSGPSGVVYEHAIEDLREKLETLEEELDLDDETAAELEARLERIEEESAEVASAEEVFESIAELTQALEQEALEAGEVAEGAIEELARAAELAPRDPDGALAELEGIVAELSEKGLQPTLSEELASELGVDANLEDLAALSDLPLDPSTLQGLSEALQDALGDKLAELADAGLFDFQGFDALGGLDLADLADISLAELADLELCEECKQGEP